MLRKLRRQRVDVRANQLAVLGGERIRDDRDLFAALEILEARGVLVTKIELGRIEHVKHDQVVARKPKRLDGLEDDVTLEATDAVTEEDELGDCRRFKRSEQVVRHTGLDVAVDCSDRHRAGGYLCRQGPPTLRWALFEAGKSAARATSPDYDYYQTVKRAHDGKLAAIAMARKIARRCYHTLRAMDPEEVYATTTA